VRLVLVEDNIQLAHSVAEGLGEDGYEVETVDTAAKAIERGLRRDMDLMILDLGLPDRDGIEVLKELRGARIHVPILVLTARDAVDSRVAALEAGADDYLVKPFAFAELVARISALVRRAGGPRWAPANELPVVMRDDLVVEAGGKTASLSPREYALLEYLALRAGELVTRTDIWEHVYDFRSDAQSNVVDVYVSYLRKKLGPPSLIHTRRGQGYVLGGEP